MAMKVTIYPNLPFIFFFNLLHNFFNIIDFGMKFFIWINPLSIQINASKWISIIATNNTIRVHARYKYKSIKPSKIFSFMPIGGNEIINPSKNLASRSLSRMNSRGNQNNGVFFNGPIISWNFNFIQRQANNRLAKFCSSVVYSFVCILYEYFFLKLV